MTNDDIVELLYLVDSTIDMSIDQLINEIAYIVRNANIPLETYEDLVACFNQTLKRFYKGDKLSEMMSVFQKQTEDEKIAAIIDKYGIGFDDVYIDGKIEGKIEVLMKIKSKMPKIYLQEE